MERVIKFKVWQKSRKRMLWQEGSNIFRTGANTFEIAVWVIEVTGQREPPPYDDFIYLQYTELKDKSEENTCIYEGDIISLQGIIIGNKYENENLLKEKVNLFIQDFGGKTWCATYKKAMERGCRHSE